MKLSDREWKDFCLGDKKYFDVRRGDSVYIKDLGVGEVPYISTTDKMQGVAAYTEACNRKGNLITLAYDGSIGTCYYQKEPFFASEKIVTIDLMQVSLNEHLAMFIIPILRLEAQMYLYGGRKWAVNELLLKTNIKLPVDNDGEPDYQFMVDYIKSLDVDVSDVPDYFKNEGYDKACWYLDTIDVAKFEQEYAGVKQRASIRLSDRAWKEFKVKNLVSDKDIHKGYSYSNEELIDAASDDYLCYVTRSDNNNGITRFVASVENYEEGNCLTIGDTTATCFYQKHKFTVGDHMIVIRADWINEYTGIFIASLLNKEKYRYPVFGRAFLMENVKNTELKLPVDNAGNPDWQFMEDYIKSLPFSAKL